MCAWTWLLPNRGLSGAVDNRYKKENDKYGHAPDQEKGTVEWELY